MLFGPNNVVSPGFVLSPHGVGDWARRSEAEQRMEMSSIGFVASEEASDLVGQTIMVDGGHWMSC